MRKFCPNCEELLKSVSTNVGHCNGCGWQGNLRDSLREPSLPSPPPKLPYVSIDIETTGLDPKTCQTLEIGAAIDDWTLPIEKLPIFHRVIAWEEVHGSPFAMAMNANLLKFIGNKPEVRDASPKDALEEWAEKSGFAGAGRTLDTEVVLKLMGDETIRWYEIPNLFLSLGRQYCLPELLEIGGNPPGMSCFCEYLELPSLFATWLTAHKIDPKSVQAAGKNFASFDMQFLNQLPQFSLNVKFRHRIIDPAILFWQMEDEKLPDSKLCYERAGMNSKVAHTAVEDALAVVRLVRQGIKYLRS